MMMIRVRIVKMVKMIKMIEIMISINNDDYL